MYKIAVIFCVTFNLQLALADQIDIRDHQSPHVRSVKSRVRTLSAEAVDSIQNVQPEENQGNYALASQANEYAIDLQHVVYYLHQTIQHNYGKQGQEVLKQVAGSISSVAHSVQQAVDSEPEQVKNVLKNAVQSVASEVGKLAEVAQQHYQLNQQGEDNFTNELRDSLYEILNAIRRVYIRGQLQHETCRQPKDNIQHVTNEVSKVIQRITSNDQATADELTYQAYKFSLLLGHVEHRLRRKVQHNKGQFRNVIQQMANKLGEVRASLDEVVSSHGQISMQVRISELKNRLKVVVQDITVQIEQLVQFAKSGNKISQDAQDINNFAKDVLTEVLAGERSLHRQLTILADGRHD